ncbi:hypothetical protein JCM15765_22630 [Paradesulfitobacterium aromaticivorans]
MSNHNDHEKANLPREWHCISDIEQDMKKSKGALSKLMWKTVSAAGLVVLLAGVASSTYAVLNSQVSAGPMTFTAAQTFAAPPPTGCDPQAVDGLETDELNKKVSEPEKNKKSEEATESEEKNEESANPVLSEPGNSGPVNSEPDIPPAGAAPLESEDQPGSGGHESASHVDEGTKAQVQTYTHWYRVRRDWSDSKSQMGAFVNLEGAKITAAANPGYKVFDMNGQEIR